MSKKVREERKQANKRLIPHSVISQAESGFEKAALMPATEKTFSLMDEHVKELSTEKFGWKKYNWIWRKMVDRSKAKTLQKESYNRCRLSPERNEKMHPC